METNALLDYSDDDGPLRKGNDDVHLTYGVPSHSSSLCVENGNIHKTILQ